MTTETVGVTPVTWEVIDSRTHVGVSSRLFPKVYHRLQTANDLHQTLCGKVMPDFVRLSDVEKMGLRLCRTCRTRVKSQEARP